MIYINLIGGLITTQFPYVFIILFGWYFSKLHALEKEMIKPLSKTVIFIFLPVYYFLWTAKATSTSNLTNYYIIILSEVIKTGVAAILGSLYIFLSGMDFRYRFTWLVNLK